MSVSYIPVKTKMLLWGKSAGRCQYRGCNECLYEDNLTKAEFNSAYIAHIVADKPEGPRGCSVRSEALKKELSNLMLLCDKHHRLIDIGDVAGHPESLLSAMKKEQEERIKLITSVKKDAQSEILIYKANVGKHSPVLTYESLSPFLLEEKKYPAQNQAIDLSLHNSYFRDKDETFWAIERENLNEQFKEQILPRIRKGIKTHFSIFAFAPIPLLIRLGVLVNDIQDVCIHHKIREPNSWNLSDQAEITDYTIKYPEKRFDSVALNISLSATINNNRITQVLGSECSIYTLTIKSPFNDFLKTKRQLEDYSVVIRRLLNHIKSEYSAKTVLHIFPAMPIATAIETGRIWMPKADMALKIYDENTAKGGFSFALDIKNMI